MKVFTLCFSYLFILRNANKTLHVRDCRQEQVKAALEMTKNMSVEEKKTMLLNGAVAEMFFNKDAGDAGEVESAEVGDALPSSSSLRYYPFWHFFPFFTPPRLTSPSIYSTSQELALLAGTVDPRTLAVWDHQLGCPPFEGHTEAQIAAIKQAYMPGPVAKIYQM